MASLAGLVGVPGRTTHCATKFGRPVFEALRTELQPQGVDVTIVYPGVSRPKSGAMQLECHRR